MLSLVSRSHYKSTRRRSAGTTTIDVDTLPRHPKLPDEVIQ